MTPAEQIYLAMVILALCAFGVTLAYASMIVGHRVDKHRDQTAQRDPAEQPEFKKAA